jgi:CheY-like chemotaxis protein
MLSAYLPELLLVEDTLDDEHLSLRSISRSGIECRVTVQRDGLAALSYLFIDRDTQPALIVLDYNLPKLNANEVLAEIRKFDKTRYIPVVVFSSSARSKLLECYGLGANSCVEKPVDPNEYENRLMHITRYWLSLNLPTNLPN